MTERMIPCIALHHQSSILHRLTKAMQLMNYYAGALIQDERVSENCIDHFEIVNVKGSGENGFRRSRVKGTGSGQE